MKKVIANASKYIFAVFTLAVFGMLMSLTYQALQRIFPTNFENQIIGLVLFDIGAICWALAFVYLCQTTGQYAAAVIGFLTAFIGTIGMVAAEVVLAGNLITVDPQQVGQWLVWGFIAVTALHVTMIYIHHAAAPEIREKIDVGIARGEIVSEAISQATKELDAEKASLAKNITHEIVSQVKRDLGLYPVQGTPFELKKNEATTVPYPTQQVLHPEHIIWDRGNDPAAYYEPGSEYALPCGHTGGESWNKVKQVHECNVCGAVRKEEQAAKDKDEANKPRAPFRGSPSE